MLNYGILFRDFKMNTVHSIERPRKRGRPLTYEEKWMVHHVFEILEKEKYEVGLIQIEDPYSLTSKYTGVARSIVANVVKAVRDTGTDGSSRSPCTGRGCPRWNGAQMPRRSAGRRHP